MVGPYMGPQIQPDSTGSAGWSGTAYKPPRVAKWQYVPTSAIKQAETQQQADDFAGQWRNRITDLWKQSQIAETAKKIPGAMQGLAQQAAQGIVGAAQQYGPGIIQQTMPGGGGALDPTQMGNPMGRAMNLTGQFYGRAEQGLTNLAEAEIQKRQALAAGTYTATPGQELGTAVGALSSGYMAEPTSNFPAYEMVKRQGGSVPLAIGAEVAANILMPGGAEGKAAKAPTFFSKLERTLSEKMPNRASAEQIAGIIRGAGVKPDELQWTGFEKWLGENKGQAITKAQALDAAKTGQVQVQEVMKGLPDASKAERDALEARLLQGDLPDAEYQRLRELQTTPKTQYHGYTLPGGENYRELLLTLPKENQTFDEFVQKGGYQRQNAQDMANAARDYQAEKAAGGAVASNTYQSGHWSEPNVLAHVRFNDRTAADGKKVLFIEEVQSDWHQAGREKGYAGATSTDLEQAQTRAQKAQQDYVQAVHAFDKADAPNQTLADANGSDWYAQRLNDMPEWHALNTASEESTAARDGLRWAQEQVSKRVPQAPFAKTWPELTVKRMIRYASENGYDRIAWTTGKQQADRYDLAKMVDSIDWSKNPDGTINFGAIKGGRALASQDHITSAALSDQIGKDATTRIITSPATSGSLTGPDLTVGGQGMTGFYDKILPETVQAYTKKWGGKVGTTEIPIGTTSRNIDQAKLLARAETELYDGDTGAAWLLKNVARGRAVTDAYTALENARGQSLSRYGVTRKSFDIAKQALDELSKGYTTTVHSLDLTPETKQAALYQGQPLFAAGGPALAAVPQQQGESDDAYKARVGIGIAATGLGAFGMVKAARGAKGLAGEAVGTTARRLAAGEAGQGVNPFARWSKELLENYIDTMGQPTDPGEMSRVADARKALDDLARGTPAGAMPTAEGAPSTGVTPPPTGEIVKTAGAVKIGKLTAQHEAQQIARERILSGWEPGAERYVPPSFYVDVNGKQQVVYTSSMLKEMGAEPTEVLNRWRLPESAKMTPAAATSPDVYAEATKAAAAKIRTGYGDFPTVAFDVTVPVNGTPVKVRWQDVIREMGGEVSPDERLIRWPNHPSQQALAETAPTVAPAVEMSSVVEAVPIPKVEPLPAAGGTIPPTTTTIAAPTVPAPKPPAAFAGNIRLSKHVDPEVQKIITDAVAADPQAAEAARRGVVTDAQVKELAAMSASDVPSIVKRWKPGTAYAAETLTGLRSALAQKAGEMRTLQVAYQAKGGDSTENLLKLTLARKEFQAVQEAVHGGTAEAGRSLRQFRQEVDATLANPTTATMQKMMDKLGGREWNDEMTRKFAGLDAEDPQKAYTFLKQMSQPKAQDYLFELWYNGMLSGPRTHVVNTLSNILSIASMVPEKTLAGIVEKGIAPLQGRPVQQFTREGPAAAVGLMQGLPDAAKGALYVLKHGYSQNQMVRMDIRHTEAFKGFWGPVVNAPSRNMAAEDVFFRTMAYRGELNAQAYRMARLAGGTTKDVATKMADILANPPVQLLERAEKEGAYRVYQQAPGDFTKQLMRMRDTKMLGVPVVRLLIPFIQTPVNVTKYGLERSPLGLAKGLAEIVTKNPNAADDVAKGLLGTGLAAALTSQVLSGAMEITADAPTSAAERDRFYREGKQPFAIKIGDKWVSYQRMEPLNQTFTQVAALVNAIKDRKDGATVVDIASTVAFTIAKNLVSQSYMQSLSDAMNASTDYARYGDQFIQGLASGVVPYGSALRTAAQAMDPTYRSVQNVPQRIEAGIPGLTQNVPEKVTALGETSKRESPWWSPISVTGAKADPVDTELGKYGVEVPFLGKSVDGIPITDEERRALQVKSGQSIKAALAKTIASTAYKNADATVKAKMLSYYIDQGRSQATDAFMRTLGPAERTRRRKEAVAK